MDATPTVVFTSIALNSIEVSTFENSFGGIMCVIYPWSSCGNAVLLNPSAISAFAPKLELELVIDMSPPLSTRNCYAKPIAKTDTA